MPEDSSQMPIVHLRWAQPYSANRVRNRITFDRLYSLVPLSTPDWLLRHPICQLKER